ncbi:class I SAM-dependent methyltransferase [Chitinophaga sp.]|uniref:class I SAM-dependent methyltransferase n=1 Tax=Chitinophaga sp. TaxID=1869181 RepID=UPI0031D68A86
MDGISLGRTSYISDVAFDNLYPERIQLLSKRHWTPLRVVRQAAQFLADTPGRRILDIGSGVGKFCLAGASMFPAATFFGVEQRQDLHEYAQAVKNITKTDNAHFLHANITQLDLNEYENFYFYNSFYENLIKKDHIDQNLEYSVAIYNTYCLHLYRLLDSKPRGTRLVTYHSLEDEIPESYRLINTSEDALLKMWVRK